MNILIQLAWMAFVVVLAAYVLHSYIILRQRETVLPDKQAIYGFLSRQGYAGTPALSIVAGEANVEFYGDFCPMLRASLLAGETEGKVTFVIGPKLSTWETNRAAIGASGLPVEGLRVEQLIGLHPVLQLRHDFPERVDLYLKRDNQYPHFAVVGKNALYLEEPHEPLRESKAIWIDKPNPWLLRKYNSKLRELIDADNATKIANDADIARIPFGYYVSPEAA